MPELKPSAVSAFLRRPDGAARAIVLSGRDRGRITEAASALKSLWLGPNADHLSEATLPKSDWKDAPHRVLEAALSPSLLGGQRLVRVLDADKAIAKTIEAWLDQSQKAPEALILLECGDLAKTDALRKLAAARSEAFGLVFYADEARDVGGLIREVLVTQGGFRLARDAESHLQASLGADRAISRGELEKLALYCAGQAEITLDDIRAVVSDAGSLEIDAAVQAVARGDVPKLLRELERLRQSGENANSILILVQRHFARLAEVQSLIHGGLAYDTAVAKLRPPLFWKHKQAFRMQIDRWSLVKLRGARQMLLQAVVDLRTTGRPESETLEHALLDVCHLPD